MVIIRKLPRPFIPGNVSGLSPYAESVGMSVNIACLFVLKAVADHLHGVCA